MSRDRINGMRIPPGWNMQKILNNEPMYDPSRLDPSHLTSELSGGINWKQEAEDAIWTILYLIGEDPNRPGLLETPSRVVRSWFELFEGYSKDPADVFKVFDENGYNELVWMKNIEFYSFCEHHMLPFYGQAHVAYIASNEKVIGASKLARLVDIFSRRLSTQERIAREVTESLMIHLQPKGAACIIEGIHLCMRCRGVAKQNTVMGTSCLRGRFLEDTDGGRAARAELMSLIK